VVVPATLHFLEMAAADQVRYLPESFEYRSPVIVQYTGKH